MLLGGHTMCAAKLIDWQGHPDAAELFVQARMGQHLACMMKPQPSGKISVRGSREALLGTSCRTTLCTAGHRWQEREWTKTQHLSAASCPGLRPQEAAMPRRLRHGNVVNFQGIAVTGKWTCYVSLICMLQPPVSCLPWSVGGSVILWPSKYHSMHPAT